MHHLTTCLVTWCIATTCPATEVAPISWIRGGTACFADQQVPHRFDGETGENILWRTPLPGNGAPIVVGDRVFVTVEPWAGYSPWLICVDAHTGEERWRRELDVIAGRNDLDDAAKTAKRASLGASAATVLAARKLSGQARTLRVYESRKRWTVKPGSEAEHDTLIRRLEAMGFKMDSRGSAIAPLRMGRKKGAALPDFDGEILDLLKGVLGGTLWQGTTYPTPCSDGRHVYVWTCQDLFAAFTLDGEPMWQRHVPHCARAFQDLPPEQQRLLNGKIPRGWYRFCTNPLIVDVRRDGTDVVLVVTDCNEVKCLDIADGSLRWTVCHPLTQGSFGIAQVVRPTGADGTAGTDAVIITHYTYGFSDRLPGDLLIRARDGAIVGHMPSARSNKHQGTGPIVTGDGLVVTLDQSKGKYWIENGDNLVAYRLHWSEDQAKVDLREIWRAELRAGSIGSQRAWTDRRLYGRSGLILDLGSGAGVARRKSGMRWRMGNYGCVLVGDVLLIPDRHKGTFHFFPADAEDGKMQELGVGRLPFGDNGTQVMGYDWQWLGGSIPWAAHNRLYLRTFDALWCVGRADGGGQERR